MVPLSLTSSYALPEEAALFFACSSLFQSLLLYAGKELWFHVLTSTLFRGQHMLSSITTLTATSNIQYPAIADGVWKVEKNTPLRPIRIFLLTHLLDTDFHAILCEANVFLLHVVFSLVGEIVGPDVHLFCFCVSAVAGQWRRG
jgi:hypothetical protein